MRISTWASSTQADPLAQRREHHSFAPQHARAPPGRHPYMPAGYTRSSRRTGRRPGAGQRAGRPDLLDPSANSSASNWMPIALATNRWRRLLVAAPPSRRGPRRRSRRSRPTRCAPRIRPGGRGSSPTPAARCARRRRAAPTRAPRRRGPRVPGRCRRSARSRPDDPSAPISTALPCRAGAGRPPAGRPRPRPRTRRRRGRALHRRARTAGSAGCARAPVPSAASAAPDGSCTGARAPTDPRAAGERSRGPARSSGRTRPRRPGSSRARDPGRSEPGRRSIRAASRATAAVPRYPSAASSASAS